MFQFLLEDRKLRDQEFAAERDRLENERRTRERETREQMEAMHAHMEKLVSMMEKTQSTQSGKSVRELSVKLVPFSEKEDIEAYLVTFERIMTAHMVNKDRWPHFLAPQLSGRAQLAFATLPTEQSADYSAIKAAILARYDIHEEAYRRRFRTVKREEGESNRELAVRLMDLQGKWLRERTTMGQVKEAIGIEQFLNTLTTEKRLWVLEKKPDTCVKAGELADEYELALRLYAGPTMAKPVSDPVKCSFCGIRGHEEVDCRKKAKSSSSSHNLSTSEGSCSALQCFNCKQFGHVARKCPEKPKDALMAGECSTSLEKPTQLCRGRVQGKMVRDILLDIYSGCSRTMVHLRLVSPEAFVEGSNVVIRCVHGDTVLYPLANIQMEVEGVPIQVEAAVSEDLPVSVLLGTDVAQFSQLIKGKRYVSGSHFQADVMLVTTRAMARRQLEEEITRREKEAVSNLLLLLLEKRLLCRGTLLPKSL